MKLEEIKDILVKAGEIAKDFFKQTSISSHRKEDKTLVTEADFTIERFIRTELNRLNYGYDIIGEEYKTTAETECAWAIDPIDGTAPFLLGLPTWCISLGLLRNKNPFQGFVYIPVTGDFYHTDARFSYLNGDVIKMENTDIFDETTSICLSNHYHTYFTGGLGNYSGSVFSTGSGIFNNMLLAAGKVQATITVKPNLWDLAAACSIVKNAGGIFEYFDGESVDLAEFWNQEPNFRPIIFTTPALMKVVRHLLLENSR